MTLADAETVVLRRAHAAAVSAPGPVQGDTLAVAHDERKTLKRHGAELPSLEIVIFGRGNNLPESGHGEAEAEGIPSVLPSGSQGRAADGSGAHNELDGVQLPVGRVDTETGPHLPSSEARALVPMHDEHTMLKPRECCDSGETGDIVPTRHEADGSDRGSGPADGAAADSAVYSLSDEAPALDGRAIAAGDIAQEAPGADSAHPEQGQTRRGSSSARIATQAQRKRNVATSRDATQRQCEPYVSRQIWELPDPSEHWEQRLISMRMVRSG